MSLTALWMFIRVKLTAIFDVSTNSINTANTTYSRNTVHLNHDVDFTNGK